MFIRLFKQECYKAETRLLNLNWREIMERREQKKKIGNKSPAKLGEESKEFRWLKLIIM